MIDHIRALYPHLSLAVYAYEPGGDVTVEVFAPDGTRFAHKARTADEAFTAVFGPGIEPPAEDPAPVDPFD